MRSLSHCRSCHGRIVGCRIPDGPTAPSGQSRDRYLTNPLRPGRRAGNREYQDWPGTQLRRPVKWASAIPVAAITSDGMITGKLRTSVITATSGLKRIGNGGPVCLTSSITATVVRSGRTRFPPAALHECRTPQGI
jgi:hypothetical protein